MFLCILLGTDLLLFAAVAPAAFVAGVDAAAGFFVVAVENEWTLQLGMEDVDAAAVVVAAAAVGLRH